MWWDPQNSLTSDHPPAMLVSESAYLWSTPIPADHFDPHPTKEADMVQLATEEQAQAYLAQIFPDRTFRVTQFEMGWVVSPIPAEDNTAGSRSN